MTVRAIDNVIFDIGNVLIRWHPERLYRKMLPHDEAIAAFLDETGLIARNIEIDRGEPFTAAIDDLVARHPHHAVLLRAFDERWEEMLGGAIEESVSMLAEVRRRGVPNYAITNFSREKFEIARDLFPFLNDFDDTVVSAHVGLVKPDPAIFRVLLDRHGLDPTRTIFIDDSAANCATARSLGLVVHHFEGPTGLAADLAAFRLLD